MGNPAPKPQVPALDPQTQQLADQQMKTAQDFAANAGDMAQQQGNMATQSSNAQLDKANKKTNQNMNSRGLLYSGINQGAKAGNAGAAASKLAGTQADINSNINDQVQKNNQTATNSQLGVQNLQTQRQALAYNIARG